jgi:hypothetical protein
MISLHCVYVAEDGTTVAADGDKLFAVSPLNPAKVTLPPGETLVAGDVSLPLDAVRGAMKNLDKGKGPLEFAALTRKDDLIELTTWGMQGRNRTTGLPVPRKFPRWKEIFARVLNRKVKARVCISRARLMDILKMMDKACPDKSGENLVFIEMGEEVEEIVLRGINTKTKQVVLGIIKPLDLQGKWFPRTDWEDKIASDEDEQRGKATNLGNGNEESQPGLDGEGKEMGRVALKPPGKRTPPKKRKFPPPRRG